SFSVPRTIQLKTVEAGKFFIRHYYGLAEVRYSGIVDLAIGRVTRWPYIKINISSALNHFDRYLFNKKKLVTKQRIDLLRFLVQEHLDGKTPINSLNLMIDLYSIKWVLYPNADTQQRTVELYLDSLVQSGELREVNGQYSVSGHAIRTIEQYEEDERRHT